MCEGGDVIESIHPTIRGGSGAKKIGAGGGVGGVEFNRGDRGRAGGHPGEEGKRGTGGEDNRGGGRAGGHAHGAGDDGRRDATRYLADRDADEIRDLRAQSVTIDRDGRDLILDHAGVARSGRGRGPLDGEAIDIAGRRAVGGADQPVVGVKLDGADRADRTGGVGDKRE